MKSILEQKFSVGVLITFLLASLAVGSDIVTLGSLFDAESDCIIVTSVEHHSYKVINAEGTSIDESSLETRSERNC